MGLFFRRERYQEEPVVKKPITLKEFIEDRRISLEDFKEDYEYLSIAKLAYYGACECKRSIGFKVDEDIVKCVSNVYNGAKFNGAKVSIYCTKNGYLKLYVDGELKIEVNLDNYLDVYNAICYHKYGDILKPFFYYRLKNNKNERWVEVIKEFINNSNVTKSNSNIVKSNSSVVKRDSNVAKSSFDSTNNDSSFNEKDFNSKLYDLCCEGSKACEELFNSKCSTAVITKNGKFICVNEKRIIEISDSKLKNLFSIKIDDLKTLYSVLINSEYGEDLKEFLETNIKKIKK